MSEVWNVANQNACVIGWIVQVGLVIAAYFGIGLRIIRSIPLASVASQPARLLLAALWPIVVGFRILVWFVRTVGRLLVRLYVRSVELASGEGVPAATVAEKPVKLMKPVGPFRNPSKDERIRELYAQRHSIDLELKKLLGPEAESRGPKSLTN